MVIIVVQTLVGIDFLKYGRSNVMRDRFENAYSRLLFCSLAVLDPRVGHTMDVLSPFI